MATDGPFKIFGDSLRQNPSLLLKGPFDVLTNVLTKDAINLQAMAC